MLSIDVSHPTLCLGLGQLLSLLSQLSLSLPSVATLRNLNADFLVPGTCDMTDGI